MKPTLLLGLSFLIGLGFQSTLAQTPKRQVLGFSLHMNEKEARARLKELGTFVRAEKREEAWKINDESFSHIIVGFGKDDHLRYVTAVAREDKEGKRVAYKDVGNLKKARQAGDPKIKNFNYEWKLPAKGEEPEMLVIAGGRDEKMLKTLSLKRLGEIVREEDD